MLRWGKASHVRPLGVLVDIRTGMQARGYEKNIKEYPIKDANARLIQAKDVGPDLTIDYDNLQSVHADLKLAAKHWLAKEQILFFGRVGQRYAILLAGKVPPNLLADKVFFVIQDLDETLVRADYLTWFLNSARAGLHFKAHETGSLHGIITKAALKKLPVPLPDMAIQSVVAETWTCWNNKLRLAKKALRSEGRFISARLEQAAWGADAEGDKGEQDETC